jgi:hypothetical protein
MGLLVLVVLVAAAFGLFQLELLNSIFSYGVLVVMVMDNVHTQDAITSKVLKEDTIIPELLRL